MLKNVLFVARKDVAYSLKDRFTIVWLLLMPGLFFFFIGTATGGFGGRSDGSRDKIAVQHGADAGFLVDQLALRLDDAGFEVVTFTPTATPAGGDDQTPGFEDYCRQLVAPAALTQTIQAGEAVELGFTTCSDEMSAQLDQVRVQRAVYTTLADIVAISAEEDQLTQASVDRLNAMTRALSLDVRPAGKKRDIPSGFQQAVPGTMVMFTLLILLTSGAISLLIERKRGVLRRLASAPMRRREIVLGKWLGKMALALVQIVIAMTMGTLLFKVHWQPDLPMIVLLLAAWAGVCTSLGLLLGSVGDTEGQIAGIGVLASMLLGGLGGCWWPIEVAPPWMQNLAGMIPTGWTMNGLHRLMSFEAGAASALPEFILLLVTAALIGVLATRHFRYE